MSFLREIGRPIAITLLLVIFVFVIRSPIFTWLNPPHDIPDRYYLNLDSRYFTESGYVTEVSDGDTFELDGEETIRMLGIDTPEIAHPGLYIKEECFGKDARARLSQLIQHRPVLTKRDIKDKDRYGRSLRFVFVQDTSDRDRYLFVNAYMIGEGFARAYIFEQDQSYKSMINDLQAFAIQNKKGLWGSCDRESFRW